MRVTRGAWHFEWCLAQISISEFFSAFCSLHPPHPNFFSGINIQVNQELDTLNPSGSRAVQAMICITWFQLGSFHGPCTYIGFLLVSCSFTLEGEALHFIGDQVKAGGDWLGAETQLLSVRHTLCYLYLHEVVLCQSSLCKDASMSVQIVSHSPTQGHHIPFSFSSVNTQHMKNLGATWARAWN